MGRKAIILVKEDLPELKNLKKRQKSLKNEKKLASLIALKSKSVATREELANKLMVGKRTIERWLGTYHKDGLEALLEIKARRTGSTIITSQIHEGLAERLNDPNNSFLGYWDAQAWIKSEYGLEVKYQRVREYLIKHFETKVKSPRKSHVKKDDRAVALFKNAT